LPEQFIDRLEVQIDHEAQDCGEEAPDGKERVGVALICGEAGDQDRHSEEADHLVA